MASKTDRGLLAGVKTCTMLKNLRRYEITDVMLKNHFFDFNVVKVRVESFGWK